jgi:hypothetical protein
MKKGGNDWAKSIDNKMLFCLPSLIKKSDTNALFW